MSEERNERSIEADKSALAYINMSSKQKKKMMKRVIKKASEDQIKILQGNKS